MSVLVYPAAFMANTFAMMLVMIGLSLFGKPALAADFGLIHGATVALFYAFSGNARSLILAESGEVDAAGILRLRLMLLVPLGVLAFMLCIGVVDGGWLFVLLLVVRRAAEWLAEIFLSEQELHHRGRAALLSLLIQGCLSLALLMALLDGGGLALPMTLLWGLSPLVGCMRPGLLRRALYNSVPLLPSMCRLLPHFGSTAIIGGAVYVFRLFILLLAGKQVAGDLFSAFALGGILGAVFSQALGPTMVHQEHDFDGRGRLIKLFSLLMAGALLVGGGLVALAWCQPDMLAWAHKHQIFWLGVGSSLIGGVVMVPAQWIRLRILQKERSDVFGADMLANILLVVVIPVVFYGFGIIALSSLYLIGAVLSLVFYTAEMRALSLFRFLQKHEFALLLVVAVGVMVPIFFQLGGGIYKSVDAGFDSGGSLLLLPLPISILFCYAGVLLLGGYARARFSFVIIFFMFMGMFISHLFAAEGGGSQKMLLLIQYILPIFALVLGQQFGGRVDALRSVAVAALLVLAVVVPLQLMGTWVLGVRQIAHSAIFFSVYQHLQYVPVMLVGLFWLAAFIMFDRRELDKCLLLLGGFMGFYVVLSHSMLAMLFMAFAWVGYALRFLNPQRVNVFLLLVSIGLGGVLGYFYVSDSSNALFAKKFLASGYVSDSSNGLSAERFLSSGDVPLNVLERIDYWRFYVSNIFNDWYGLMFGHSSPPERELYPSAHNYYIDFTFNFGLVGVFPLLVLVFYTLFQFFSSWRLVWFRPGLLGLSGVVLFFVLFDNSMKVSLRQPYSGILMFFLWGLLVSQLSGFRKKMKCEDLRAT